MHKCAVFTISHNEPAFLPIWLRYYSRYFEPQDIYVADHNTTDGSIESLSKQYSFHLTSIINPKIYDMRWLTKTIRTTVWELCQVYEYVLYSDADELVFTDPAICPDLRTYIDNFDGEATRCVGYGVVHTEGELPYNPGKPITEQRRYWHRDDQMAKTLLTSRPLPWLYGLHDVYKFTSEDYAKNPSLPPNPVLRFGVEDGLSVVHLQRMDWDIFRNKREAIDPDKFAIMIDQFCWHLRLKGNDLKTYFYQYPSPVEEIPERFLGVF